MPGVLIIGGYFLVAFGFQDAAKHGWLVNELMRTWKVVIVATSKITLVLVGFLMIFAGIIIAAALLISPYLVEKEDEDEGEINLF